MRFNSDKFMSEKINELEQLPRSATAVTAALAESALEAICAKGMTGQETGDARAGAAAASSSSASSASAGDASTAGAHAGKDAALPALVREAELLRSRDKTTDAIQVYDEVGISVFHSQDWGCAVCV